MRRLARLRGGSATYDSTVLYTPDCLPGPSIPGAVAVAAGVAPVFAGCVLCVPVADRAGADMGSSSSSS